MKPKIAIPEPCSYDPEYSARTLPPYLHAIGESGGEPVLIPLNLTPEEMARRITGCSGVLLPGSKADVDPQKYNQTRAPETAQADSMREAAEELLLQDAYNLRKPILGICYGLQSLNVWRSGTLVQHLHSQIQHAAKRADEFVHSVRVNPASMFQREILQSSEPAFSVNSTHHQAAELIGDGLRAVAVCAEDGTIEAVEGTQPGHSVIAVQWHPERSFDRDTPSRKLFEWLVRHAEHWHEREQNA
jgi:putative glutamine amidotransferase